MAQRIGIPIWSILSTRLLGRLLPVTFFILGLANANDAAASCKPIAQPKFAHVPMRVAVASEPDDNALPGQISYVNSSQSYYELIMLPRNDLFAHVAVQLDYDALLVFDREMMNGHVPKYNRYLRTYRDQDISTNTMIADYPFDDQSRVGFAFMQIAASNAWSRSLLMEIVLMALADSGRMADVEFVSYYEKVDAIVEYRDDELSPSALDEIMEMRKEVILGCFLRADHETGQ